jgi:HSP90 family molecular chaperone
MTEVVQTPRESHAVQADVSKLLHMMVDSVYSTKGCFYEN